MQLFAVYWVIAAGLCGLSYRLGTPLRVAGLRIAGLEVALVDVPMVFWLQYGMLTGGVADRGIAGFSAGLFVALIAIAGLGLDAARDRRHGADRDRARSDSADRRRRDHGGPGGDRHSARARRRSRACTSAGA